MRCRYVSSYASYRGGGKLGENIDILTLINLYLKYININLIILK